MKVENKNRVTATGWDRGCVAHENHAWLAKSHDSEKIPPMRKLPLAALASLFAVIACTPDAPKFAFKHTEKRGKLEKNGIRFVLMPDESTPLVNVAVRWDVGGREDPPGKAGLAHIVEHLMFQPRPDGPTSAPLFQSIVNMAVGGDMNAYTSEDTTHYYETVRSENLDDAIKIEAMRQFYFFNTITDV